MKPASTTASDRIKRMGLEEAKRSTEEHIRWLENMGGGWQLQRQREVLECIKSKKTN